MRIEHEIDIKREPGDVFAYLSDPEKLSAWQSTAVAVRRQRQGPLTVGEPPITELKRRRTRWEWSQRKRTCSTRGVVRLGEILTPG
jgi:hypothetical protein